MERKDRLMVGRGKGWGRVEMGKVSQNALSSRVHPLNLSTISRPVLHLCRVIAGAPSGLSEHNFPHLTNGPNYMALVRNNELLCVEVVRAPTMSVFHQSSLFILTSSPPLFPCQRPLGWWLGRLSPSMPHNKELTIWSTYYMPGTALSTLHALLLCLWFNLTTTLGGRCYNYTHFTGKAETQRGCVSCPRSHSQLVVESGLKRRSVQPILLPNYATAARKTFGCRQWVGNV